MCMAQRTWIKKTIHRVETHRLPDREKVQGTAVSEEGHVDIILGHESANNFWFLLKSCNIVSYCHIIRQKSPYFLNDPLI